MDKSTFRDRLQGDPKDIEVTYWPPIDSDKQRRIDAAIVKMDAIVAKNNKTSFNRKASTASR